MQKYPLLEKIRNIKSFKDLLKKIGNKIDYFRKNGTFIVNNWIVSSIYGKMPKSYKMFYISSEVVKEIRSILDSSRELKLENNHSKDRVGNEMEQELYDYMNGEQTWFETKESPFFDNFFKKIKPIIKDYLKSPFTIVHLNAWKTKPNMKKYYDSGGHQRGPNRLHADGYPPGHYKCMIYLQPLDSFSGKFQFEEKIFESEKAGSSIIFNPNLIHAAIPGNTNYRYCLELTLLRTAIEVNMLKHYGRGPDDKWFLRVYQAYI